MDGRWPDGVLDAVAGADPLRLSLAAGSHLQLLPAGWAGIRRAGGMRVHDGGEANPSTAARHESAGVGYASVHLGGRISDAARLSAHSVPVSDIPEHFTIELPAVPVHLCGGREKTPVSRAGVCANAVHGKHFLRVLHVPHLCDRPLLDPLRATRPDAWMGVRWKDAVGVCVDDRCRERFALPGGETGAAAATLHSCPAV